MSTVSEPRQRSTRLRREDWLKHALETLRREGVSGLRVEPLARSLGVTTGSFYWHFSDRQELLTSVLDHWTETMTRDIAVRMTSQDEPLHQLDSLLTETARRDQSRHEIAIRNWAVFDDQADGAVRRVDECRMAYVNGLFLQLGFSEKQAGVRARMFIFYSIGEAGFSIHDSLDRRLELGRLRLEILTSDC
jgi:AcrR family transcriptional regulator